MSDSAAVRGGGGARGRACVGRAWEDAGEGAIDGAPQSKRGGCEPPRGNGGGARQRGTVGAHGNGTRARPRTAPVARRRDGDIAPYRHDAREICTGEGRGNGARRERTAGAHGIGARRGRAGEGLGRERGQITEDKTRKKTAAGENRRLFWMVCKMRTDGLRRGDPWSDRLRREDR